MLNPPNHDFLRVGHEHRQSIGSETDRQHTER